MNSLRIFLSRLRAIFLKGRLERELDEEIRTHLEMQAEDYRRLGMGRDEARFAALRQFGGVEQVKEEYRDRRSLPILEATLQDLRYGARTLRKSPVFTSVAILSLALGIGANTAIFQLLDAIRLRALPVAEPQQLAGVRIADMTGARGSFDSPHPVVTNPVWERIRDRQEAFSGVFAWGTSAFNLSAGGEARNAQALWVSGDFFNVLGVQPLLGRVFTSADDQRGCGSAVAVISYPFWQREFGGDPSVVGQKLTLKGRVFEIIGVTPASFFGLEPGRSFDVAVPICTEALLWRTDSRLDKGTVWWLIVMGRLKPGWSLEQASSHLSSISQGVFETSLPSNYPRENISNYLGFKLEAFPAGAGVSTLRETYESSLWLLLALAGLVLLIACANLANLMLTRASVREREIAVRLALGASRGRLIRQLLAESLLLAVTGAALGAMLAQSLSRFLVSLLSAEGDSVLINLDLDWRVLAFTIAMTILTCILFGLTPALRATRVETSAAMKSGGRGLTASRERFGLRRALVVSQVAISLMLMVGALLFSRSLANLMTLDPGFRQDGILITSVSLTRLNLPAERRQLFKQELLDRIRAVPGVESAADTNIVPLGGAAWGNRVWMDGSEPGQRINSNISRVSSDYFKTLGTPLLAGREFEDRDKPTSPKVAIVNEAFARQLINGANPVGNRFWIEATPNDPETLYEIVGLVKDSKYSDLREEFRPIVFLPTSQDPRPDYFDQILIRSSQPVAALTSSLKQAIGDVNREILINFQVFKTQIQSSLLRERLMATLSGFFGLLALLLACIGLYGVMSYSVAGRTNEIGIRMALGAQPRNVLNMVLREALILAGVGVALGLPAVLATKRLISSLLFGLSPADPASIGLAALLMIIVAAAAGYIPARRASRVDPVVALRFE